MNHTFSTEQFVALAEMMVQRSNYNYDRGLLEGRSQANWHEGNAKFRLEEARLQMLDLTVRAVQIMAPPALSFDTVNGDGLSPREAVIAELEKLRRP